MQHGKIFIPAISTVFLLGGCATYQNPNVDALNVQAQETEQTEKTEKTEKIEKIEKKKDSKKD
jgi:PBP1b-binding outer membrane lipoprotein LpoB